MDEISKLKDEYDALDKEVLRLSARRAHVWKLIRSTCTHSETTSKYTTYPGSYYDRGYTEYYDECNICQTKLNIREKSGYYG